MPKIFTSAFIKSTYTSTAAAAAAQHSIIDVSVVKKGTNRFVFRCDGNNVQIKCRAHSSWCMYSSLFSWLCCCCCYCFVCAFLRRPLSSASICRKESSRINIKTSNHISPFGIICIHSNLLLDTCFSCFLLSRSPFLLPLHRVLMFCYWNFAALRINR